MRKRKMHDKDIWKLQSKYHDFYRVVNNETKMRGIAFVFDKLSQEDIEIIKSFQNTIISKGQHQYAPELFNYRVILLDKCIAV